MTNKDFLLKNVWGENECGLIIDLAVVTLEDYLAISVCLRDLYRSIGRKVSLTGYEDFEIKEDSSPYELFEGTGFSSTRKYLKASDNSCLYPRQEVYNSVAEHVVPSKRKVVIREFERRINRREWGENIPITAVCQILLGEHLDDLI